MPAQKCESLSRDIKSNPCLLKAFIANLVIPRQCCSATIMNLHLRHSAFINQRELLPKSEFLKSALLYSLTVIFVNSNNIDLKINARTKSFCDAGHANKKCLY